MHFIVRVIQIFLITFTQEYDISFYLYHTMAISYILSYYYWIKKLIRIFYDGSFPLSLFSTMFEKKINKFSIDPYQKKESILSFFWIFYDYPMLILKMNPNSLFPRIFKFRRMFFLLKKLRYKVRYCLTFK